MKCIIHNYQTDNKKSLFKCIICYTEADIIFQATTYCKEHFEKVWAYLNGDRIMGRNILQMKQEFARKKQK